MGYISAEAVLLVVHADIHSVPKL